MIPKNKSKGYNFLYFNKQEVIGSYEGTKVKSQVKLYFPFSILIYIEQGSSMISCDGEKLSFSQNSFFLIRKFTRCTLHKTVNKAKGKFKFYVIALKSELIRKFIQGYDFPKEIEPVGNRILKLKSSKVLLDRIKKVDKLIEKYSDIDKAILSEMTDKTVKAIIKGDKKYLSIFKEYTLAERADLVDFMEHNYLRNIILEELAKMSGRSLSTFNREFKMIFNETPHRWIMNKRLRHAKKLLTTTNNTVTDVCMSTGFKNLTHFGKKFKAFFGVNPSEIKC